MQIVHHLLAQQHQHPQCVKHVNDHLYQQIVHQQHVTMVVSVIQQIRDSSVNVVDNSSVHVVKVHHGHLPAMDTRGLLHQQKHVDQLMSHSNLLQHDLMLHLSTSDQCMSHKSLMCMHATSFQLNLL